MTTKTRPSAAARCLLNAVRNMRYIESMGARDDTSGRETHGWSAKDSWDDSQAWARHYAERLIGAGC